VCNGDRNAAPSAAKIAQAPQSSARSDGFEKGLWLSWSDASLPRGEQPTSGAQWSHDRGFLEGSHTKSSVFRGLIR